MMYILTQKEFDDLNAQAIAKSVSNVADLQRVCTLAAVHTPIYRNWSNDTKPWGCILDKKNHPGYCDSCPVSKVCPHPHKEWSK